METTIYQKCLQILKEELIPAIGCTEPVAVAYAASEAVKILGKFPDRMEVFACGNMIKNIKSVTVPNSHGMKGIEAAAVLGAVGGNPDLKLETLSAVTDKHCILAKKLLDSGFCQCFYQDVPDKIYLLVRAYAAQSWSEVLLRGTHTNIVRERKDGTIILEKKHWNEPDDDNNYENRDFLSLQVILEFADHLNIADVKQMFDTQIKMAEAISDEGLDHTYGANVGKMLLKIYGNSLPIRAAAKAAAGSDARMSGCVLPVVTNSGSGNQGLTVTLPILEYAKELVVGCDRLYRALAVGNLVSIFQKEAIGRLSAYCGAVCAGGGAAAGIAYLYGGDYDIISKTITNIIGSVGGILCDGAKPSCAAKIASSVLTGILGMQMAMEGEFFADGEGIVKNSVEDTVKGIGKIVRDGMIQTDRLILKIMMTPSKP
jgi:L-cysteine desulfidase